jgi:hypothetical protein
MQSIEARPVHSVKPYENNPRVNDHAVDAVAGPHLLNVRRQGSAR